MRCRSETVTFGDSRITFRDSQRSHSARLAAATLAGQLCERGSLGWLYCPRLRQLLRAWAAESEQPQCPVPPRLLWCDVLLRPLCNGSHGGQGGGSQGAGGCSNNLRHDGLYGVAAHPRRGLAGALHWRWLGGAGGYVLPDFRKGGGG